MMNQLKQCQPAASAKERSDEPAGTRIEKLAGEEEYEQSTVDESVSSRKDITDGLVVDDVIGDVIQSQESAGSLHPDESEKRRRRGDPVASYSAISRCYLEIAKRCRLHKLIRQCFALALKIQQEDFALLFQQTKLQSIQSQRKDIQSQCFECPVARRFRRSFWTTRCKQQQHPVESLFESAVAIYSVASYSVQSQEIQAQRIEEVAKRSSRGDKSAAKQLTTYEVLSKLDVNC
ncbi:hypothetical protein F511_34585 [Dorcoceras hygrometricum]|uniref:Uncharacterized protein n=1 Tax=Dorcoceras hygrometricum TaxID=472368 RepID=A0A2Z7C1K5_9LAMI|nr:hypothetical protein F511_34585 [Dorcoceras hygrometricum]